jgi:hypothetical protein
LNNISLNYPIWYVLFCVAIGLVFAFVLYRRDKLFNEVAKWVVPLLSFLRFTVVTIAAFLLLEPLIKTEKKTIEKPIIVIAQDNSQSILINKDSAYYRSEYPQALQELKDQLSEKYEVKTYSFGDQVSDSLLFNFNEKQTDFTDLLDEVYATYYGRNLGALIIASDGIYNKGQHPLYTSKSFKNTSLFTVALGDTTIRRDLLINNVAHNKLAYLGNDFPVEVVVKSNYYKGKSTTINIKRGDKIVATHKQTFEEDNAIVTIPFKLEAKNSGKQKYVIEIAALEGELTISNNEQTIFIEVLDNKQEILILSAAPHPDIAAMNMAIEKNINYKVTTIQAADFKGSMKDYNLIIFHQIPSTNAGDRLLVQKALKAKVPSLFIIGGQSNIPELNKLKLGLTIVGPRGVTDAKPSFNNSFNTFTVDDDFKNLLSSLPPLQIPFASDYKVSNSFNTFLSQKIGSAATDYPLIGFNEVDNVKYGFVLGEGMWRWKFQDFIKNENSNSFDAMISKCLQFLALKENKNKFKVSTKGEFLENEHVIFQAELYNDIFELVNESEVTLLIQNENGEEYPQKTFSRVGDSYRLDAGTLPPGNYNYIANASFNSKAYKEAGAFIVRELKIEFTDVVADHSLLFQLANENQGKMYYPSQLSELGDALANSPNIASVSYIEEEQTDIIKWKWIFGLLLLLLSIEWFMRKRNGAY